uniref:Uncharacterized protein n=3 Tax=Lygus hesperus TaxID=30085 RepID=A0A0A9ZH21_LYGHE
MHVELCQFHVPSLQVFRTLGSTQPASVVGTAPVQPMDRYLCPRALQEFPDTRSPGCREYQLPLYNLQNLQHDSPTSPQYLVKPSQPHGSCVHRCSNSAVNIQRQHCGGAQLFNRGAEDASKSIFVLRCGVKAPLWGCSSGSADDTTVPVVPPQVYGFGATVDFGVVDDTVNAVALVDLLRMLAFHGDVRKVFALQVCRL